jgi:hypothetical protein
VLLERRKSLVWRILVLDQVKVLRSDCLADLRVELSKSLLLTLELKVLLLLSLVLLLVKLLLRGSKLSD